MTIFNRFVFLLTVAFSLCHCVQKSSESDQHSIKSVFQKLQNAPANKANLLILDSLATQMAKSPYSPEVRDTLIQLSNWYLTIGRPDKYKAVLYKVLAADERTNDTLKWASTLRWFGDYYESEQSPDSAFSYYLKAEKLYRLAGDTLNYGKVKSYKASILYDRGNFTEGLSQGIAALQLIEQTSDARLNFECQVSIALCLKELKDYDNTLKYFDNALVQLEKLAQEPDYPMSKIVNAKAETYNNIGTTYERLSQYAKAIDYYNKALQITTLHRDMPRLYSALLANLAYAKMKQGKDGNVLPLFNESLRIRDSLGWTIGIISSQLKFGEYYLMQQDTTKALLALKAAYHNAVIAKVGAELQQSLRLLTVNDSKNKDFYSRRYIKVIDSLQTIERATQNRFARIAYETEQVVAENKTLSDRNQRILIVAGVLLIFAIAAFLLFRLHAKNKELDYQKEQQRANETIYELMLQQQSETQAARNEERNRIAMELHDGIVNSIFTTRFNLMQLETEEVQKKQKLVSELEKTEQEVRKVSHELEQNFLNEDQNLPEIIGKLVAEQQNESRTAFDFSSDKHIDWSLITSVHKIHLYRIVQEALQNVNKYAKAQRCLVMLFKSPNGISLRVWDNGIGFRTDNTRAGIGLKNIKNRTDAMGATLRVQSEPKKGTTIEVSL